MTIERIDTSTKGAALLEQHSAAGDAEGRLHEEVVAFIRAERFDKMLVPPELGGLGLSLPEAFDLIDRLSYLDPSVGWVCFASSLASGWSAACLPSTGVEKMFPGNGYCGVGIPGGVLKPVKGGYLLTGKWPYASGLLHAEWANGAAMLEENGQKRILFASFPAGDVTKIHDWDTLGLRATGSISFTANELFVEKDMAFDFANPTPIRRRPLFSIGFQAFLALVHGAWAAGTGRRAIDEAAKSIAERAQTITDDLYADFAATSFRISSAAAFSRQMWQSIQAKIDADVNVSTTDVSRAILGLNCSTAATLEAGTFAFARLGSKSIRAGGAQKLFRDICTGATHATSSKSILVNVGRQLSGAVNNVRWGPKFSLLESERGITAGP